MWGHGLANSDQPSQPSVSAEVVARLSMGVTILCIWLSSATDTVRRRGRPLPSLLTSSLTRFMNTRSDRCVVLYREWQISFQPEHVLDDYSCNRSTGRPELWLLMWALVVWCLLACCSCWTAYESWSCLTVLSTSTYSASDPAPELSALLLNSKGQNRRLSRGVFRLCYRTTSLCPIF